MSIPYLAASRRYIRKRQSTLAYPILAIILAILALTSRSGNLALFSGATGGGEGDLSLSEQFKFTEHDHVENASAHQKLVPRVDPDSIGTYESRVFKGRGLMCLMNQSTIDPDTQSQYTTADLGCWGWEQLKAPAAAGPGYGSNLDAYFTSNGITTSANNYYAVLQSKEFFVDGLADVQEESMSDYQSVINEVDGILIADNSRSPQFATPGLKQYPDLSRWSDLNWLMWKSYISPANIPNINKFIRANIQNKDTKTQIARAFKNSAFSAVPIYPGYTFEIDPITLETPTGVSPDPFLAMIGAKNPSGCAYFLAQHKGDLGIKTINSITVWQQGTAEWYLTGNLEDFAPYMILNVIDKHVS